MHLDEDTLLRLSLQLVELPELRVIEEHLRECSDCAQRLARIQGEVTELGAVRTEAGALPMPLRSSVRFWDRSYLRAAALLFMAIGIGTLATWSTLKTPPIVVPCTLVKQTPADSVAHVVFSDDTEVRLF